MKLTMNKIKEGKGVEIRKSIRKIKKKWKRK